MDEQEQIIKIAEHCGWTNVSPVIIKNVKFQGDDQFCGITSDNGWIPNYLNDLNACHEMEMKLIKEWSEYLLQLWNVVHPLRNDRDKRVTHIANHFNKKVVMANSAQRCEAFLKTIGKWEESP